jgi:hypothetical protein
MSECVTGLWMLMDQMRGLEIAACVTAVSNSVNGCDVGRCRSIVVWIFLMLWVSLGEP